MQAEEDRDDALQQLRAARSAFQKEQHRWQEHLQACTADKDAQLAALHQRASQQQERRLAALQRRTRAAVASAAFQQWRTACTNKRRLHQLLMRSTNVLKQRRLLQCFRAWQAAFVLATRQRKQAERLAVRHQAQQHLHSWQGWRQAVQMSHHRDVQCSLLLNRCDLLQSSTAMLLQNGTTIVTWASLRIHISNHDSAYSGELPVQSSAQARCYSSVKLAKTSATAQACA